MIYENEHSIKKHHSSGATCGGATPDPIPNSEVKPASADGTRTLSPGRVGQRRNHGAFLIGENVIKLI